MRLLKQFFVVVFLTVSMAACSTNPLVHTAQDGTEVRFDDLYGSIQAADAITEGAALAVANAYHTGTMSEDTARKMKTELQKVKDGLVDAEALRKIGDVEAASAQVGAAKVLLNITRETLKRSGIDIDEARL